MRSSRRISFAGWNAAAGKPAKLDVDVKALVGRLAGVDVDNLVGKRDKVEEPVPEQSAPKKTKRALAPRRPGPSNDPEKPEIGRWAIVVLEDDADQAEEALRPLIEHRIGQGVAFHAPNTQPKRGIIRMPSVVSANPERWRRALEESTGGKLPYYLLLVGGPRRFPFDVQVALAQEFATGRIDVGAGVDGAGDWDACRVWADKLVRYESGKMEVERRALLYSFATDRPTRLSHAELSEPLAAYLDDLGRMLPSSPLEPKRLFGHDATTERLCQEVEKSRPAVIVTASHGLEWFDSPNPRDDWGALTDEGFSGRMGTPLDAARVRQCASFAPGAVMVSFACFSAGVPAESVHRLLSVKAPNPIAGAPYTSALPRALLAHPNGPVAFVGHVDRATSKSFQARSTQQSPAAFMDFIQWSLGGQGTLGQAMSGFRDECGAAAGKLAQTLERARKRAELAASSDKVLEAWIRYHDAAGYVLLGDPVMKLVMA